MAAAMVPIVVLSLVVVVASDVVLALVNSWYGWPLLWSPFSLLSPVVVAASMVLVLVAGGGPHDHCCWLACVAATMVIVVIVVAGGSGFCGPRHRHR